MVQTNQGFFFSAPDVVIYDFACGLHSYCLNREAEFFKFTKFLIDRYHQPNHKGEWQNWWIVPIQQNQKSFFLDI